MPPLSREARSAVVELLVALALDHKNDARELSSEMLAELVHRRVLTQSDVRCYKPKLRLESRAKSIAGSRQARATPLREHWKNEKLCFVLQYFSPGSEA